MKKTLIFEGAGWDQAEHNGVGNCRIRTRLTNNKGKKIYLELSGHQKTGNKGNKPNGFCGYVWHCFYKDCNENSPIREYEKLRFKYTKENILNIINNKLNCSYDELVVINDNSIRVHDTKEALC